MYNSVFNSQGCPDSNLIENEMYNLKAKLDSIAMYDGNGNPFWSARDLQSLLGYVKWQKFEPVVQTAIQNCIESGFNPNYQFVYISPEDAEKFDFGGAAKIKIGHGYKYVSDYHLTRYACKLITQNGDPRKKEIACAKTYFALATDKLEDMQDMSKFIHRETYREGLKESEKGLSSALYNSGISGSGMAQVRSSGDSVYFGGNNTAQMKDILGVPKNRSINDFLGNVPSLFKAAAAAASEYNIGNANEINIDIATDIHNRSNKVERDAMIELVGIAPEDFPAEEDYNKIKRKANKLNDKIEKGADYYIDPSLEDSNNSPITENEFNYFVSRGYVFIKTSDLIFYRMYGCLPQDA